MTRQATADWSLDDFNVPETPGRDRFHDFALPLPLMRAIFDLGFEYCTPIQSETLPYSLADYDVTGQAQTGTGKTAAFLISILTQFWESPLAEDLPMGCPRALILAPTRELALQIEGDAKGLSRYMEERTVCVVGGMDFQNQLKKLEKKGNRHCKPEECEECC